MLSRNIRKSSRSSLLIIKKNNVSLQKIALWHQKIINSSKCRIHVQSDFLELEYEDLEPKAPRDLKISLMNLVCSIYNSLTDLGLCYIEPSRKKFDKKWNQASNIIGEENKEEVFHLFTLWAHHICQERYALGILDDDVLDGIEFKLHQYGIDNSNAKEVLNHYYDWTVDNYGEVGAKNISDLFNTFLEQNQIEGKKRSFLNPSYVTLHYGVNEKWYRCEYCKKILPFTLKGRCGNCFKDTVSEINDNFENVMYLRRPVLDVINNNFDSLNIINAEEHTAQLSHKDQRDKNWSTTEQYELRFQNVYVDDVKPVDILSCTTTMEVGIDIGSLTAIGMRNIPPSRENYQQRSGRAGRRGSSISTIVSYADSGRYDNYYFIHPDHMVSGDPRTPWIDSENPRLVQRHIAISVASDYFRNQKESLDKISVNEFYEKHLAGFEKLLKKKIENISCDDNDALVPSYIKEKINTKELELEIHNKLMSMKEKIIANPDLHPKKFFDFALEEGLFPTYSFPKNVIGFNILGKRKTGNLYLKEKPERQLDLALNEYAPGREITVNKNRYISGGILSFISKGDHGQTSNTWDIVNDENRMKKVYMCGDPACPWFGLEEKDRCPFCGCKEITERSMIIPWGFTPANGTTSIGSSTRIREISTYASVPIYSIIPDSSNMTPLFKNIRFERREEQKLLILNKGPHDLGFTMCLSCGAIAPGPSDSFPKNLDHPLNGVTGKTCIHKSKKTVMLGYDFLTDLVVFEINIDSRLIDADRRNGWIDQASTTLSEALCLIASDILDVDANDIQNGYRIIDNDGKTVIELYLFDSLSSGAGYCSRLTKYSEELFIKTRDYLESCQCCDSACFNCLKNYWNRNKHDLLDRYAAIDLLDWAMDGILPQPISSEMQTKLKLPLSKIIGPEILNEVYIYPAAWSKDNPELPRNKICLSDLLIEKTPSKAYGIIKSN